MLTNHIRIAWRNLLKNKFYSAINIIGLIISLTVSLLILLWVNDEIGFDRYHDKVDQIYRINSSMGTGATNQVSVKVQAPVADSGIKEVPGIINAVRMGPCGYYEKLKYQDKIFKTKDVFFSDPSIFKVFSFKLLKGDLNNPFPDKNSIILTETVAKRYFGTADPIGKVLAVDSTANLVVSGVVADFPKNSSIRFEMLVPINSIRNWARLSKDWTWYILQTYLQIQPGVALKSIEDKLNRIHHKNQPLANITDGDYHLQSLKDIHLYAPDGNPSGFQVVRAFLIVAILILLLASVNYVNLSTARAIVRAKEVSVRKILGAGKIQLYMQFFIETLLFFFIAITFVIILIKLLMPYYNYISNKQMQLDLLDFSVLKVFLFTLIFTIAASSIYPILLLSSFNPVNALKGKIVTRIGSSGLKKVLIVGQFAFTTILIGCTLIMNSQLKFIRNYNLGYDKTNVFYLTMHNIQEHYEAIREELLKYPQIAAVTSGRFSLIDNNSRINDTEWDTRDKRNTFVIHTLQVDKDFVDFFKLQLTGENFSGSLSDTAKFILNETAVKESGITNPIGKRFMMNHSGYGVIIGVVKDFNFTSLKKKVAPLVFVYSGENRRLYIKAKDPEAAIKVVATIWKRYNSDIPFEYSFLDEEYNELYKSDQQVGKLFNLFSGVSIFISCLGLFGLAVYTTQVKTKEIGIRKVLGASVEKITRMLLMEFLKLIIISIVIATPIAWYIMTMYLEDFAYRTNISFWTLALAACLTLMISLIAISIQSLKAALSNPVNCLRSE